MSDILCVYCMHVKNIVKNGFTFDMPSDLWLKWVTKFESKFTDFYVKVFLSFFPFFVCLFCAILCLLYFKLLLPCCGEIKIYRVDQKTSRRLTTIILSSIYRFINILTGRFLSKFAVKWILKIPSHLAHVATLPCETLMSKLAISDKLQSSVATYLRCGGVVIKKGLFLIDVYLAKLQARAWLSHALCAPS